MDISKHAIYDDIEVRKATFEANIPDDQLKNLHQIEQSRHRSVNNFFVNIMAAIIAYCLNPNKPRFKNMLKK